LALKRLPRLFLALFHIPGSVMLSNLAVAIGKVTVFKPKLSLYANGTGKAHPNDPS
jgi:hypothetical protein